MIQLAPPPQTQSIQPTPPTQGQARQPSPLIMTQNNNPSRVVVELSQELFTTAERLNCSVNGKGGEQLDPAKVALLGKKFFQLVPVPKSQQATAWKVACKTVDSHTRYLQKLYVSNV